MTIPTTMTKSPTVATHNPNWLQQQHNHLDNNHPNSYTMKLTMTTSTTQATMTGQSLGLCNTGATMTLSQHKRGVCSNDGKLATTTTTTTTTMTTMTMTTMMKMTTMTMTATMTKMTTTTTMTIMTTMTTMTTTARKARQEQE